MSPDARVRLEALGTVLRVHGLRAWMSPDGLHVENPEAAGCCSLHPCVVLTVGARQDDGGQTWFFTTWGHPLAEAEHIADTLTAVKAMLHGRPGVAL